MLILLQVLFVILFGFIQGFLVIFHLLLGLGWKQVGKLELGLLRLKEKKIVLHTAEPQNYRAGNMSLFLSI